MAWKNLISIINICFNFRNEKSHIKLPLDIEDAKNLGRVLDRYKDKYYIEVLALVFVTYILYPFSILYELRPKMTF